MVRERASISVLLLLVRGDCEILRVDAGAEPDEDLGNSLDDVGESGAEDDDSELF